MTARPSAGPTSAYPTLSGPASTCFSAPNGVPVPGGISVALIFGAVVIAAYRGEAATARAALRMWSVTACGWEIMITCEPSISRMSAPARWACDRMTPFQLEASAKAPCTSTIVGLASVCWDRWSVAFIGNLLRGENAGSCRAHRDDAGTDGMTAPHVASRARPAWVLLPGSAARLGYAHMMTAACP